MIRRREICGLQGSEKPGTDSYVHGVGLLVREGFLLGTWFPVYRLELAAQA